MGLLLIWRMQPDEANKSVHCTRRRKNPSFQSHTILFILLYHTADISLSSLTAQSPAAYSVISSGCARGGGRGWGGRIPNFGIFSPFLDLFHKIWNTPMPEPEPSQLFGTKMRMCFFSSLMASSYKKIQALLLDCAAQAAFTANIIIIMIRYGVNPILKHKNTKIVNCNHKNS